MQTFTEHKERDSEHIAKVQNLCTAVRHILFSNFGVTNKMAIELSQCLRDYLCFDVDQCLKRHDEMKKEWFEQHIQHLSRGSEALSTNESRLVNLEEALAKDPHDVGLRNSIIAMKQVIDQIRDDMARLQEVIEKEQAQ